MLSHSFNKINQIVADAGGQVVGRTRLQKIAYLLSATGLLEGFNFSYKHYGPFSEDFASAVWEAGIRSLIVEEKLPTTWGGTYSIYKVETHAPGATGASARSEFASLAARAGAVELELAATAVFLAKEGYSDAWGETARRNRKNRNPIDLSERRHFMKV